MKFHDQLILGGFVCLLVLWVTWLIKDASYFGYFDAWSDLEKSIFVGLAVGIPVGIYVYKETP